MPTILVVDDDEALRETLVYHLELAGYLVLRASDGQTALELAQQQQLDLMILDIMLPGIDGLEVCRRIRRQATHASLPILMLTAMGEEIDRVVGLEVGADDYLSKPFSLREFLARVRALLRRGALAHPQETASTSAQAASAEHAPARRFLEAGPVRVDLTGRRVFCREQEVVFQPKQFELLVYFLRHQGVVLSRDTILTHVWGYDYAGDTRTVDVHVRWLREKLEEDPSNPTLIHTVRGVGYCWR